MPVGATTRYGKVSDVFALARSLMNDPNGILWTDKRLLGFMESSYRSLQEILATSGVSVMRATVDIDIPLVDVPGQPYTPLAPNPPRIADDTDPQLPTDCVVPWVMQERAMGSTDVFSPMEKLIGPLPSFQPLPFLRVWKWEADEILLVGSTAPVTVRLTYERALPKLGTINDPVLIPHATGSLAFELAALCARSRGQRALAQDMEQAASSKRDALVNRYAHAEQFKPRRKKPYGYRRRVVYL